MPQPRVPTAKLEARGSFLKHPERKRARKNEPQPTGELGDPPKHLDRDEKAAWIYVASLLPPGVAKNRDRVAMEEIACLLVSCRKRRATSADSSRVSASQPEKPKNDPWDRVQSPKLQ